MDRNGKPDSCKLASGAGAALAPTPNPLQTPVVLYSLDGSEEHFAATVLQRQTSFFELRTAARLEPGRRVVLVEGNFRYEIEILACKPEAEQFTLDCRVLGCREGTIRQEWRMPVNLPARISVPMTGLAYSARIRDISPFGMGLSIPIRLAKGSVVVVDAKDGFGYGEVRHCREEENGGFFVGIYLREYLQKSGWLSRQQFTTYAARWWKAVSRRLHAR